jgi:hypothetical protein
MTASFALTLQDVTWLLITADASIIMFKDIT